MNEVPALIGSVALSHLKQTILYIVLLILYSLHLPILDPSLPIPISCDRIRCISGQGETVPGDRCGVKSDQTRNTCWSKIDWSLSSSGWSFFSIASVNTCPGCPPRWLRDPSTELASSLYIIWSNRSLVFWSRCSSSSFGMSAERSSFWLGGRTVFIRDVSGTTTYEFVSGFMCMGWSGWPEWSRERRGWVRPSLIKYLTFFLTIGLRIK